MAVVGIPEHFTNRNRTWGHVLVHCMPVLVMVRRIAWLVVGGRHSRVVESWLVSGLEQAN